MERKQIITTVFIHLPVVQRILTKNVLRLVLFYTSVIIKKKKKIKQK